MFKILQNVRKNQFPSLSMPKLFKSKKESVSKKIPSLKTISHTAFLKLKYYTPIIFQFIWEFFESCTWLKIERSRTLRNPAKMYSALFPKHINLEKETLKHLEKRGQFKPQFKK